ncbi:MAG: protocatechuate 3,4-dioxygenase subunit alpha [Rhizobiaceae bacterium]
MMQALGQVKETPSQTAGPYVHIGCTPNFANINDVWSGDLGSSMVNANTNGKRITVTGRVLAGIGTPLKDCLVEIWQADANGLYNSPAETRGKADPDFAGWGRCAADSESGLFTFETVKPGTVPFPDYGKQTGRFQAPHISFWIVARGINLGLNTRMYFPEEEDANTACPVLGKIEHKVRLPTLIASRKGSAYTFDIHLQGDRETVFFSI